MKARVKYMIFIKTILLVLVILINFGCGQGFVLGDAGIDPLFRQHIAKFERILGVRVNVAVQFADLWPNQYGVCHVRGGKNSGRSEVEIDAVSWDRFDEGMREQILFHELGHCVLGLNHDNSRGTVGRYPESPLSIMYMYSFGDRLVYQENLDYYYNELYQKSR